MPTAGFLADHGPGPRPGNVNRNHQREEHCETTCCTHCDHGVTADSGSCVARGRCRRPAQVTQRAACWNLEARLVAQRAKRWRQTRRIWSQSERHLIYTSDGHFAFVNTRSDLPKLASNSRDRGTPEENKAVVQGSLAYFGTYSVNEADKVITVQIEGSTFANMIGRPDQRRIITSLAADELKFTNPATTSGAPLELVWKRAK
jgi:hypothetical protein